MLDKKTQEIVDFLFVFQYEVGILHQDMTGNIGFYGSPKFERFTKELREETRRIARYVIADEINSNINRIRLQYDGSELEPSWVVPDLLSALYFSIFYLEPGKEMYRRCENPRCNHMKFFSVPITTKNKKYCCVACERAVAQRNYRKNHRN